MMAAPKRVTLRGDSFGDSDAPNIGRDLERTTIDVHSGPQSTKPLSTSKSVASMYISSVLAASSSYGSESPPQGGKNRDTIHKAAERGHTDAVLGFIRKKKSLVNAHNDLGHVPLHIAALHNCYDVVQSLLRNDADINLRDNVGWTPLHFACSGKSEKLIQLLLDQKGIDGTRPALFKLATALKNH